MAVTKGYKCADCGEIMDSIKERCSKCGSNRINPFINIALTMQLGLRAIVKELSGRETSKVYKRQKLSRQGKEAKEELHIDVNGNRKVHHVEEKDDNGNWKVVHHEDEPLKKKEGEKAA